MATSDALAKAAITAYCGWDPTTTTAETTVLDGTGTDRLFLPTLKLTAVTSVIVTLDTAGTTYDASAEIRFQDNGEIALASPTLSVFPDALAAVEVAWAGGYGSVPADLQAVIDSIASRTPGVDTLRIGTALVRYGAQIAAGGLLTVEAMVLDRYRIMKAA